MIYCVEIQTVQRNGSETWHRVRYPTAEAAIRAAFATWSFLFCDHHYGEHQDEIEAAEVRRENEWAINDLGLPCCVRAREYGDRSQIRLGTFTVDFGTGGVEHA